jgi:hypothetical protein
MHISSIRAMSHQKAALRAANVPPNISYGEGFLIHDEYEPVIFDDLRREYPVWAMVKKVKAVGDWTAGFVQTGFGAARMVDKNNIDYSATTATRSARTPREIKALTSDRAFGIYGRSVYAQQGQQYGDLTQLDLNDMVVAMRKLWTDKFYNGTSSGDPLDFDGLKILCGSGSSVSASTSVIKAIRAAVITMINTTAKNVRPTHILTNAMVADFIRQEQEIMGEKMVYIQPSDPLVQGVPVTYLDTAAGRLPVFSDPFNSVVAGTPDAYPTFIVSMDKLRWEFIEVLGSVGPEPKVVEFKQETDLSEKHKAIQFGALDGDAFSDHTVRLNIATRTTVINPTA